MDFDKGFQTQAFALAPALFVALFIALVYTLAFLWLWGIIEFIIDGFKSSAA